MRGGLILIKIKSKDITAGKLNIVLTYKDKSKKDKF